MNKNNVVLIFLAVIVSVSVMPFMSENVEAFKYCCNDSYACENISITVGSTTTDVHIPDYCAYGCSSADFECRIVDLSENSFYWAFGLIITFIGVYLAYVAFVEYGNKKKYEFEQED